MRRLFDVRHLFEDLRYITKISIKMDVIERKIPETLIRHSLIQTDLVLRVPCSIFWYLIGLQTLKIFRSKNEKV